MRYREEINLPYADIFLYNSEVGIVVSVHELVNKHSLVDGQVLRQYSC